MALENKLVETQKLPILKPCDIKGRYRVAVSDGSDGVFLAGEMCADLYGDCKGFNLDCPYFQELNYKYFEELSKE
jgi:hypothetical protein